MRVQGNYDVSLLVESGVFPPGYVVVAASMGKNASGNPMAIREHPDPAQQGLRQIAGIGPYPVVDSHFARCFGVGTRHRGAACVIQVTTNASTYTAAESRSDPDLANCRATDFRRDGGHDG